MKEIRIDDIQISNDKPFVLIAGLNVLEEEKVILEVISKCKEDAERNSKYLIFLKFTIKLIVLRIVPTEVQG